MKLQDKETLNVADAVKDVLEGKKKAEQYDAKKDHDMDPKSHVVKDKKTGMYDVYNMSSKKVKSFKDKEEAEKYAIDNHDALMKKESPDEPRAKGEKDFKDKHSVKKSGMKDDGTNMKEAYHGKKKKKEEGNAFTKALMAARKNGDDTFVVSGKKYKVEDYGDHEHPHKDDKKKDMEEMSDKQKKYQAFFNKALKKFGVKSPAELEGDKKKEFYDYVDANYEADNEAD